MLMYDAIKEAETLLKDSVGKTIERLENEAEEFDSTEAFNAMVALSDFKGIVRDMETRINVLLTSYMRVNGEKVLYFGDMVAERKFTASRKNWEHQVLLQAVVNNALSGENAAVVDPSTGEVVDLTVIAKPIIDSVVDSLAKAAAIRDWRVTALRAMIPGLNPDDFCEVEKAERVSIRRK